MDLLEISIAAAIFTLKLTLFIYIGLFVANIACKREKILRLGIIFNPLVRWGKLPECCAFYFLMSMVNLSSAAPTLLGFYKKGLVSDDKQVIAATITAGLPIMFWYVLFFTGPIAIGLFGIINGILFLAVWCAIGLIETMIGVIYGRTRLSKSLQGGYPEGNYRFDVPTPTPKNLEDFKQELKEASKDSFGTLMKIMKILAPVIFILYVIINCEAVMSHVNESLRPIAGIFPVEAEALPITISSAFNLIVALSLAQQLIMGGLPLIDAFMAIIVGMFLFNFFELFHSLIPYNVAFFGRKLGLRLAWALFLAIGASELAVILILWSIKVFMM